MWMYVYREGGRVTCVGECTNMYVGVHVCCVAKCVCCVAVNGYCVGVCLLGGGLNLKGCTCLLCG